MLVYPTLVSNNPLRRSRASETLSRNSLRVPWSWCSRANSSGVSGGPGRSALFLFFAFSAKALCAGRLLPSPAPTVPRAVFLRRVSAAARAARPTVPVFLQGQHGSVDFRGLRAARRLRPRDPFRPSTPGRCAGDGEAGRTSERTRQNRASSRVPPDPVPLPDPLGDRRLPSEAGSQR